MKKIFILFLLVTSKALQAQEGFLCNHCPTGKSDNKNVNSNSALSFEIKQSAPQSVPYTSYEKQSSTERYTVITLAGQNIAGSLDGHGYSALLSSPASIAVDAKGNLYVADATNNKIRKITPDGLVSTFAGLQSPGKKDGTLTEATFYYPAGIAIDCKGNFYVADKGNHVIRKISPDGIVTTIAGSGERNSLDGLGTRASFDKPVAVAVDSACNIYVADAANHKIRKITPIGAVTTLAGSGELGSLDGKGVAASFYNPSGVAVDPAGNVYVADHDNNRIRKVAPDGTVTTIAGSDAVGNADGHATEASFFNPSNIAIDVAGNLYVTDQINHTIRKISTSGDVTTLAGNGTPGSVDGSGKAASFNYPSGIAVDVAGNIYVADQLNCKIRKIVPEGK